MEKFRYDKKMMEFIESAPVPFAVYQFLNPRVVTIALSAGFCVLFGYTDRAEAYYVMDNDMYRDAHPDDVSRISDAALRFATSEERYNVVYRSRRPGEESYTIVHAFGKHVYPKSGVRLAVVWYVDEGGFARVTDDTRQELNRTFNSLFSEAEEFRENYYDLLTGLPNMTHFFDLADVGRRSMQEEGEQTAVLYIFPVAAGRQYADRGLRLPHRAGALLRGDGRKGIHRARRADDRGAHPAEDREHQRHPAKP